MSTIVALANQKGEIGKTTSTYNIGVSLAKRGKSFYWSTLTLRPA
jgi:cellulose biosynthesis protein BcsQ